MARRPLLIVAGVLAVAVALFFGVQALTGDGWFTARSTLTMPAAQTLHITSSQGDIEVRAREGASEIAVSQRMRGAEAAPVTGDAATLTIDSTGVCPAGSQCTIDLEVTVPPGTNVEVLATAGDVSVSGSEGTLSVQSQLGDVELEPAATTGVTVRTGAGDIEVKLPDGRYAVTTSAGVGDVDVAVTNASDGVPVDLTTGAGDIDVLS